MRAMLIVGACTLCICLAAGCGDDGGGGTCPDMSGVWNIVDHCVPSFKGGTVAITQNGCDIVYAAPFTGWTGTVSTSGATTVAGVGAGGSMTCSGTLSGNAVSLTCNPTCDVKLQR